MVSPFYHEDERPRIAAVLTNYNMPERAEALWEHLIEHVEWPVDLILVDNASDLTAPAEYTVLCLPKNVQTTRGWLAGLRLADIIEDSWGRPYLGYMLMITSAEIPDDQGDIVTPMAEFLIENEHAVGIMPALTADSEIDVWHHMMARGGDQPRRVMGLDSICTIWRADWFNKIGRFDPAFEFAWGVHEETCWKARKERRSLWVHEGLRVKKVQDIGYAMDRMNMTALERRERAMEQVIAVMTQKYGAGALDRMNSEFVEPEWR